MKKMFFSLVAVAILFASCGTQTETPADVAQVDTFVVSVDTVSAQADSLAN